MAATFSAVCKHLLYTTLHAVKNWTIVQEHTPSHTRHSSPLIGRCIVTLWALPRQTGPQSLNLSLFQHNWGMKQFEVSSCDSRSISLGQLPCSPVQAPFIVWSVLVVSAAFNPKRSHHHKWISTLITTYVRCARLCSISMHKRNNCTDFRWQKIQKHCFYVRQLQNVSQCCYVKQMSKRFKFCELSDARRTY